jgi:PIN domain nuclease of toxin-antitoxin system
VIAASGRLLLDTHVLLWWLAGDPNLPAEVGERIDTELEVFVSPASIWEIEIKRVAGKLEAPADLVDVIEGSGVTELPIRYRHAELAGRLPPVHRDPFDRLLVAQAMSERLTLVSRDANIRRYDVALLAF